MNKLETSDRLYVDRCDLHQVTGLASERYRQSAGIKQRAQKYRNRLMGDSWSYTQDFARSANASLQRTGVQLLDTVHSMNSMESMAL